MHASLKDFFDSDYPEKTNQNDALEPEIARLITFIKTKQPDDIKMSYRLLKGVFEQIEKNYKLR